MALAVVGAMLAAAASSGHNDVVAAFSPPPPCRHRTRRRPTPRATLGSGKNSVAAGTLRTGLAYTQSPDDIAEYEGRNETALDVDLGRRLNEEFVVVAGLIRELEHDLSNATRPTNTNLAGLPSPQVASQAIEPGTLKPSNTFISPIDMLKKIPKVKPVDTSSVFFLGPTREPTRSHPNADEPAAQQPAVRRHWQTPANLSTTFTATGYLGSLGAATADDARDDAGHHADLMRSLRDQQGHRRRARQHAQQEATYRAMRRTSPRDAFHARVAEEEARRQEKERDRLKLLYVARKERLAAQKRRAGVRREAADAAGEAGAARDGTGARERGTRGVPILERPFAHAPPLLIGSTVILRYSALTPFQQRAVDMARSSHQEQCEHITQAREEEGSEVDPHASPASSIWAAPIIAVVDGYTGAATAPPPLQQQPREAKRYATLAAIEVVESAGDEGPTLELMGVGRVLLYDYFSSKEAGLTKDEQELARIRARIREFDEGEEPAEREDDPDAADDDGDDVDVPVVMAEFDLLLDDASVLSSDPSRGGAEGTGERRASPAHAVTELYRAANRVYRLHEERKKLVAGLRAAEARLRLGTGAAVAAAVAETCLVEFEDCDGLGRLLGGVPPAPGEEHAAAPAESGDEHAPRDAPRSRLAGLENYGLDADGALATLPELTARLMARLAPYYSPAHRAREEYEAEVASFAVLTTLAACTSPEEVAAALVAAPSSARRRLERGYEIMRRHRDELRELAESMSRELAGGEKRTELS